MKLNLFASTFICLLAVGSIASAFESVPVSPETQTVRGNNDLNGTILNFVQLNNGTYGIQIGVQFNVQGGNPMAPPSIDTESANFVPAVGTLHRQGNAMIYSQNGQDVVIAAHSFWHGWTAQNCQITPSVVATDKWGHSYVVSMTFVVL